MVLDPERDLDRFPVTQEERLFLELAFVHFHTGWLVSREEGGLTPLSALAADAGHFFDLPVPGEVWQHIRHTHQPEFVAFVEDSVRQCRNNNATKCSSGVHLPDGRN